MRITWYDEDGDSYINKTLAMSQVFQSSPKVGFYYPHFMAAEIIIQIKYIISPKSATKILEPTFEHRQWDSSLDC